MKVLSQNGKRLVNDDFVNQYMIEESEKGKARILADLCQPKPVLLGEFETAEHAKDVLHYLGGCLSGFLDFVGERDKLIKIPTDKDMTRKDNFMEETEGCPAAADAFIKLFKEVIAERRQAAKSAGEPSDFEDFLAAILNT